MTDYFLYAKAHNIRTQEQTQMLAVQAWFNQQAKATKQQGKKTVPRYKKFSDFYDADREFRSLFTKQTKKRTLSIADRNRILQKSFRKGGNE